MVSSEDVSIDDSNLVIARLPLVSARLKFDWDAVAGVFRYPDIHAAAISLLYH